MSTAIFSIPYDTFALFYSTRCATNMNFLHRALGSQKNVFLRMRVWPRPNAHSHKCKLESARFVDVKRLVSWETHVSPRQKAAVSTLARTRLAPCAPEASRANVVFEQHYDVFVHFYKAHSQTHYLFALGYCVKTCVSLESGHRFDEMIPAESADIALGFMFYKKEHLEF